MDKNLDIIMLMDFYGQLLTEKQLTALDMYYNQDYSLSEIAEYENITRQGVRDSIKRGEKQLEEFENMLGLAGRFTQIVSELDEMDKIIKAMETSSLDDSTVKQLSELEKKLNGLKEKL